MNILVPSSDINDFIYSLKSEFVISWNELQIPELYLKIFTVFTSIITIVVPSAFNDTWGKSLADVFELLFTVVILVNGYLLTILWLAMVFPSLDIANIPVVLW